MRLRCRHHGFGIGDVERHWFFNQHMFAGLHGGNGLRRMLPTGGANTHGVNVITRQ